MTINFNELSEIALQHMNNGDGTIFAKMMMICFSPEEIVGLNEM